MFETHSLTRENPNFRTCPVGPQDPLPYPTLSSPSVLAAGPYPEGQVLPLPQAQAPTSWGGFLLPTPVPSPLARTAALTWL